MTKGNPQTTTQVADVVPQTTSQKVDLLFMIDNSRSMGDKQQYLAQAVPDLLQRLLTPNCVDAAGKPNGMTSDANGSCAQGSAGFPPVHDMHIGVVSSALGSMGGDECGPSMPGVTPVPDGQNDDGQLLDRGGVAMASTTGFLAWYPTTGGGASPTGGARQETETDSSALVADFQRVVTSVGQNGCGIEAQLESWYRFLVQPDPYQSIYVDASGVHLDGYDAVVLKQRHDFLRPDSLLAIIDLSDENDSTIDVRSNPGTPVAGYNMMTAAFAPYRGTGACATNPTDPACTSCAFASGDPACSPSPLYTERGTGDPQASPNLRHVRMKQSFGLDQQFPIERYVNGLTSSMVPNRSGEYPEGAQTYDSTHPNCANPIFSQDLPDGSNLDPDALCNLIRGPRRPDLVFYAHIGGVPHDLLQENPSDPDSPQKEALTEDDWRKILGADPAKYDESGIDPRMHETFKLRATTVPWKAGTAPEVIQFWDLAYSCTFPLASPRDCTDPANSDTCDCAPTSADASKYDWELCDPNDKTKQVAAKAFPTLRELWLAKLLGPQGVVSSLCPIHAQPQNGDPHDPLYGYRPAMTAIVDRLKTRLGATCLPRHLTPDPAGAVPCLVLASLPTAKDTCDASRGQHAVDPQSLAQAAKGLSGQYGASAFDPTQHAICEVDQLTGSDLQGGSCSQSNKPGWCYVTGTAAGELCQQAVLFSPGGTPTPQSMVTLVCLEGSAGAPAL
jgi:hypothetical protein